MNLPDAFVTFGWCRSAYTVCRSLKMRGVRVHVGDASIVAMTRFSRHCDSFSRLPDFFLSPAEYVLALVQAMRDKGAKVLLPCSEDVEVVLRFRDLIPEDIRIAAPTLENWIVAEDKYDYLGVVAGSGCAVPRTIEVDSRDDLGEAGREIGFPLILKVRNGNGARGVAIVADDEQLRRLFDDFVARYGLSTERWPVLQERIVGVKYQMDGVFRNGQPYADGVYEILRAKGTGKFGTSTYRVTVNRPDIQAAAHAALAALDWHGIFNLDWLCDSTGTPYLIDINGRLGGAVSILYEAGLDLPWAWYQLALGHSGLGERQTRDGVATKWLLGELLAVLEHIGSRDFAGAMAVFSRSGPRAEYFDDFNRNDPVPFLFELVDYVWKFARARGSLRPTVKGMVR